jgi:hypothetical protein
MLSDLLIGLVWVALIMIPVLVAHCQPLDSGDGYFDRYMDGPAGEGDGVDLAAGSPSKG